MDSNGIHRLRHRGQDNVSVGVDNRIGLSIRLEIVEDFISTKDMLKI